MGEQTEIVIITGMSGAGKTVAMQNFEDMGYYCVDNMPPKLIPTFFELFKESGHIKKIALVMDLRTRDFFEDLHIALDSIENSPRTTKRILFLDASNEKLVTRYKETRRSHPLEYNGRVITGIERERDLLNDIKFKSQVVIDTTNLAPKELRSELIKEFKQKDDNVSFRIEMLSFGFKHGLPIDADIVMDVRFLPNPHYIDELRPQSGLDSPVYDYVMEQPETEPFYRKFIDLLDYSIPGYKREGKANTTIAIGCTGGQHRSVALTERIGRKLRTDGYKVNISHRDVEEFRKSSEEV